MNTNPSNAASIKVPDEPLIDVNELSNWLAISPNTLRKWIHKGPEAGLMPRMLRINGQLRFRPADVRAWLDKKAV
ncbi:putative DNA-binding transcriptional regulator AlpA [Nocardioides sp. BE266]|uniref:helix-turn-helix domain-containing protein n=1 Tax=Nocardioides sp. BE266 TaxID=2817725 RepID=UPI002865A8D5|nr:helix-turn-helix domain-containing protein [Nocardioides sp. BE266]MDR7252775.1 putative DNA-binding transcriptional regulator AlpA [Nocardioides sp. BE266]